MRSRTRNKGELSVTVIRPSDLIALDVRISGCALERPDDGPPVLRAGTRPGLLVAELSSFQHLFEEAGLEGPDGPVETITPPVDVRPAGASRLAFTIPAGAEIEYTTAGLLHAMSRLQPAVHPLATPGDAPAPVSPGSPFWLHVEPGLAVDIEALGPVIRAATQQMAEGAVPRPTSVSGLVAAARGVESARALFARTSPTVRAGTRLSAASVLGRGGGLVPVAVRKPRDTGTFSRPPTGDETAIEAPYRLLLSPSIEGRWAHSITPAAGSEPTHVELWHTRLASMPTVEDGPPDEHNSRRRVVRAVWARDRDHVGNAWKERGRDADPAYPLSKAGPPWTGVDPPFRGSLDRMDRHRIVRQSAERWPGKGGLVEPVPVAAESLHLSSLGSWLDLHGSWATRPYTEARPPMSAIESWDHLAPMGRDQFVRVVDPGYLYPLGHRASLIRITERRIDQDNPAVATLHQYFQLAITERRRSYGTADLPFSTATLSPPLTPVLDPPTAAQQATFFWPGLGGQAFRFTVDATDRTTGPVRLDLPLMWVSASYHGTAADQQVRESYAASPLRRVDLHRQPVGFVARKVPAPDADIASYGDPQLQCEAIWLSGVPGVGSSRPLMTSATVLVPAVERVSPTGPVPISYRPAFLQHGFGHPSVGDVWADIRTTSTGDGPQHDPSTDLPRIRFGEGAPVGSDRSGGFVNPDLPVRALSRTTGPVGDPAGAAANTFDPVAFLQGALPKLFGMVDLVDLIETVTGDPLRLPAVISDTLSRAAQLYAEVQRVIRTAEEAVAEGQRLIARAQALGEEASAELHQRAAQAKQKAEAVRDAAQALLQQLLDLRADLAAIEDLEDAEALVGDAFDKLEALVAAIRDLATLLPPFLRTGLTELADTLAQAAAAEDLLEDLFRLARSLDPRNARVSFSFTWNPQLQSWPAADPIFLLQPDTGRNLAISVTGAASAQGTVDLTARAELRDFALMLLPGAALVKVPFDHLSFVAGTGGKPEIDVALGRIQFLGILGFVETIRELIPLDGFSDPPYVDVSPSGAQAGFTLALPSVAIGVFNLSNMSLGADVQVPFLGKAVTVGFAFCARERPFSLTVMCLGGGGWFLLRVSPDGLDVLEVGLEAQAALSVDFGVASGSISAAVGIYMRLEADKGSLTGYFRLRGEVDVLGLISASIELLMELIYDFDTGKMVGRARITVEVDVLLWSGSVSIETERQLAGSNGDPPYAEILDVQGGESPTWSQYCSAFAGEA